MKITTEEGLSSLAIGIMITCLMSIFGIPIFAGLSLISWLTDIQPLGQSFLFHTIMFIFCVIALIVFVILCGVDVEVTKKDIKKSIQGGIKNE